jgi:hypothetical protein
MTNRDAAVLAFRLLGLWLIASALIGLASVPYIWDTTPAEARRLTIGAMFLPSLVTLGVGVPVWFCAEWFASRTFATTSAEPLGLDRVTGQTLLAAALAIMGIFFIADGIPALVNGAALFVQSYTSTGSILGRDVEQQRLLWSAAAKANTAAGVARLMIGLALLAGPAKLTAALTTIRRELRGTLEDEESSEKGPTA